MHSRVQLTNWLVVAITRVGSIDFSITILNWIKTDSSIAVIFPNIYFNLVYANLFCILYNKNLDSRVVLTNLRNVAKYNYPTIIVVDLNNLKTDPWLFQIIQEPGNMNTE